MDKQGKVVRVLSPFEVVVNLGLNDGVHLGHRFLVYALGDEIQDPETRESLGQLEIVRGRGSAKHVQDKFTTVRSTESTLRREDRLVPRVPRPADRMFPSLTERIAGFPEKEVLTEDVSVPAPFDEVKVGDLVRVL